MFVLGVRVSTWIAMAAFGAIYLRSSDRRVLIAVFAWLGGFEVAYQATSLATDHPLPAHRWGPALLVTLGVISLLPAARARVWPSLPLAITAFVLWAVWLATGFQLDHGGSGEALNEATKTVWAVAYLAPLWRSSVHPVRV